MVVNRYHLFFEMMPNGHCPMPIALTMIVIQVDSSSWEFLSAADSSTNSTPTSTHRSDSTSVHKISTTTPIKRESKRNSILIEEESRSSTAVASKGGKSNRQRVGGSRDSVYESEYDR